MYTESMCVYVVKINRLLAVQEMTARYYNNSNDIALHLKTEYAVRDNSILTTFFRVTHSCHFTLICIDPIFSN